MKELSTSDFICLLTENEGICLSGVPKFSVVSSTSFRPYKWWTHGAWNYHICYPWGNVRYWSLITVVGVALNIDVYFTLGIRCCSKDVCFRTYEQDKFINSQLMSSTLSHSQPVLVCLSEIISTVNCSRKRYLLRQFDIINLFGLLPLTMNQWPWIFVILYM